MIIIARLLLFSAVIGMVGIMAIYHVTEPNNIGWLNGVR